MLVALDHLPCREAVRQALGNRVRQLLTGDSAAPSEAAPAEQASGDAGLFGPASVTWQVHANLSMLIGGLRALLLQTLHPLAMAGVAQHSAFRQDPWGRLHRTAGFLAATTFGSTAEAEAAIARVSRVHDRVRGTSPDGIPYRANDPQLLAWVHATEVDSFLRAYRRYGEPSLDAGQADRYVAEMAQVAARLGVIKPPESVADLRTYLVSVRPELRATAQAREAVRFLLVPPAPLITRPAYAVVAGAAIDLLPGFVRRELWLPSIPLASPLVVRPVAHALLDVLGWALGPSPAATRAAQRTATPPIAA